jgi:thiosulfate/3-mercaptopyruvate sulfurtransferase
MLGFMKIPVAFRLAAALLVAVLCFSQQTADPWPKASLLEPSALAETLRSSTAKPPVILCVAFPVLYKTKHILHAVYAGQGSKPEGIETLKQAVAGMAKDSDIVLYCGCCPMERCPNMRPAYRALKEMGYTHVRVLSIPTNMATDWYSKDYPSEAGSLNTSTAVR